MLFKTIKFQTLWSYYQTFLNEINSLLGNSSCCSYIMNKKTTRQNWFAMQGNMYRYY